MAVKVRQRNGAWWIYIDHHGKRKAKKIGSKAAAEQVKRRLEREIALGGFGIGDATIPKLQDYAATWMAFIRARYRPSTAANYQGDLNLHILPLIGAKRLDEITRQDVKSIIVKAQQKGRSVATIKGIIGVLSGCLGHAIEDELITNNPAQKPGKLLPPERSRQVSDWLRPDEIVAMLEAAKARYPEQYELLNVLAYTGMRLGEALGLEWGDIDYRGKHIRVRRSRSRWGVHEPKTKRERVVDIDADLAALLRNLYARRAEQSLASGHGVTDRIFLNQQGEPISGSHVRERFGRILKRAGLRRVRLHDLRHSYASNLLQAGFPIQFVSRQLGHASIRMTVDVYGHLLPGGYSEMLDQYRQTVNAAAQTG